MANKISDAIASLEWQDPGAILDIGDSREMVLACDFGGSHKSAEFEAFGFLLGAIGDSWKWMQSRDYVRNRFLPDHRRMAYKALNDKVRQRALPAFLRSSDMFPGNLFIFLISKKIRALFGDPGTLELLPELIVADGGWKQKSFRRLLLAASLGSLLIAGLSSQEQNILWISDEDEIAPNKKQHNDAGHVIHHCISRYSPACNGVLTFATTEADFQDGRLEDLVSVVDLAAGALVDAYSADRLGSLHNIWKPLSNRVSIKARTILRWFAEPSVNLHRFIVVLDQTGTTIDVQTCRPALQMEYNDVLLR